MLVPVVAARVHLLLPAKVVAQVRVSGAGGGGGGGGGGGAVPPSEAMGWV